MNTITEETTKEEILEEYSTYPSTFDGGLEKKPWYENRIAPIFYEIPVGSKVLDVGCNDGGFMHLLATKRQCDVKGVDVSDVALNLAKEKGLDVYKTDGDTLPFPDHSFDVVVLMEVIIHVHDPQVVLNEIRRVLKKNGILLGTSPHSNLERYLWDDKRLHRRYYDEAEIKSELEKVFPDTYTTVMKGAQFSMGLANTFLGDQPCELFFKCGRKGTLGWDAALKDKDVLRAWFGFSTTPGTVYYRMSGFCNKMQELGAETFYEDYNPDDMNSTVAWIGKIRFRHVQNQLSTLLKAADMSVWQLSRSWDMLALLKTIKDTNNLYPGSIYRNKPLLTEMDDWIFDVPSYNAASNSYRPNSDLEKMAFDQIEISDAIICSTKFIEENIKKVFPNKPVYIIPNAIDFKIWDDLEPWESRVPPKKPGVVRIGYTGCGNHSGDVELAKKAIVALLDEFPNLEMVMPIPFDSWMDVNHPRLIMSNLWVSIQKYPHMVKGWDLDIAIAPLRDNNLNRAKSNLRWLEHSALKIPTVASDIYPFHNSITDGKDGILVRNSTQQWYDALKNLIMDKDKRVEIGLNAYDKVKRSYNMDKVSKKYLSILRNIKNEFTRNTSRIRPIAVGCK